MIDVRGRGGLVVAAGAIRDTKAYELADDRDPVPLPGWLTELATRQPPVTRDRHVTSDVTGHVTRHTESHATGHTKGHVNRYATAALNAEISVLLATRQPGRNHQLNRSAFSLGTLIGAGDLTENEVTTALQAAAETIGLIADDGPEQCARTITSGLAAGISHPRTRKAA